MKQGVLRADSQHVNTLCPARDDYDDIYVVERPDDDDEEAVGKYLNVELTKNTGTIDKGREIKRERGLLDVDSIGRSHTNPLSNTGDYEIRLPTEHAILRRRSRIVSKVKSRYWKTTHEL